LPTFYHARNTYFSLNNGSERDLSTFITDVTFSQKVDDTDTTTFTSSSTPPKTFLTGFTEREIKISGVYDPTATTGPDAVLAPEVGGSTARVFKYGPYGSTSTYVRYTGSCWVTGYNIKGSVGSAVQYEATLKVTGTVTRDTF
jgi:hypothetical protein